MRTDYLDDEDSKALVKESRKFIVLRAMRQSSYYVWLTIKAVFSGVFLFLFFEFVYPLNTGVYDSQQHIQALNRRTEENILLPKNAITHTRSVVQNVGQSSSNLVINFYKGLVFILDKSNLTLGLEVYTLNTLQLSGLRQRRSSPVGIVVEPRFLNGLRFYAQPTGTLSMGFDVAGILYKDILKKILYSEKPRLDPVLVESNYVNLKQATEAINLDLKHLDRIFQDYKSTQDSVIVGLQKMKPKEAPHNTGRRSGAAVNNGTVTDTQSLKSESSTSARSGNNTSSNYLVNVDLALSNMQSSNLVNPQMVASQEENQSEQVRSAEYHLLDKMMHEQISSTIKKGKTIAHILETSKVHYNKAPLSSHSRDLLKVMWKKRHHIPLVRLNGPHPFFINIRL